MGVHGILSHDPSPVRSLAHPTFLASIHLLHMNQAFTYPPFTYFHRIYVPSNLAGASHRKVYPETCPRGWRTAHCVISRLRGFHLVMSLGRPHHSGSYSTVRS